MLPNEPSPTLIPLSALRIGPDPVSEGWVQAAAVGDLAAGTVTPMHLAAATGQEAEVIVVNVEQRLTAYRNECAHEGLSLDNALLDLDNGTLTCPWHGFCFDAPSGQCLSAPGAQPEQLPLRVGDGHVWGRVGA